MDTDGNFDFESDEAVKSLTWIQDGVDKGWYPPQECAKMLDKTCNAAL